MVDGTFLGPDAIAELVAMHLHRLGAARGGKRHVWERRHTMDLGPNPDDRAAGQIGRGCRSTKSWTAAMPLATFPWLWRRWG